MRKLTIGAAILLAATAANGAVQVVTTQGNSVADLGAPISSTDLIQGMIATELPGDKGWHSANSPPGPGQGLDAFTDGLESTGNVTGLLNDFPGVGTPTKKVQYNLGAPRDIAAINVFTGNNGRDGRVFHIYTVEFSSDGSSWTTPIYVQSHQSGTLNNAGNNQWRNVLTQLSDTSGTLAANVLALRFDFYSADNGGGQMRDAYDGLNPFTGVDDTLTAAHVSPLVWEIDVVEVPEPAAIVMLGLGAIFLRRRARA